MLSRCSAFLWTITACAALAGAARAQCTFQLASTDNGIPGVLGAVAALASWDPDGAGPAPALVVVGGNFTRAGTTMAQNLAAFEPVAGVWQTTLANTPWPIEVLASTPSGRLFAANGVDLYEWLPLQQSWQPFAVAAGGAIRSLAELGNGDLVVAGAFTSFAGLPIGGIVRWNGAAWSAFGAPTLPWAPGAVESTLVMANGDLAVSGSFTQIGGIAADFAARWDGTTWHAFGPGPGYGTRNLVELPNGDLVAVGPFSLTTSTSHIARWNGSQWAELAPSSPLAKACVCLPNGDVVAFDGQQFWSTNGVAWSPFASWVGTNDIGCLLVDPVFGVYVGGQFAQVPSPATARGVARWDGLQWRSLGRGTDGSLTALAAGPNGTFAAGGWFTSIEGVPAQQLAYFDGTSWSAVGNGVASWPRSVALRSNGEFLAIASFTPGSPNALEVRHWQGGAMLPVGPPGTWTNWPPQVLAAARNGDAWIACGPFLGTIEIGRWNGTTLSLQSTGVTGAVSAMVELPDGSLALSGAFVLPAGTSSLVRWDGVALTDIAGGPHGGIRGMAATADGGLAVVGQFTAPAHNAARWDGAAWHPFGAGLADTPSSVAVLPNGDVIADEGFLAPRLLRWDGSTWQPWLAIEPFPIRLVLGDDGTLFVASEATTFGGAVSAYVARLVPGCPSTVTVSGSGCAGAAGPIELHVDERPWLGGELRTTTTGIAPGSLAATVFGLTLNPRPLATLHPLGAPGCTLWCDADLLLRFDVVADTLASRLAVPNAPSLLGAAFHHQVVPVEVDAVGDITALVASPAVTLSIGAL